MKRLCRYTIYAFAAISAAALPLALSAASQTLEQIREELRKAEEEKKIITQLMDKTAKDRQNTETQLKLTISKKYNSQKAVNLLDRQIDVLERNIGDNNSKIRKLTSDQNRLKASYARMVRSAYENYKLNNFMLFLFASDDFNDVTRRVDFMRRYNQHREQTAMQLRAVTDSLGVRQSQLDQQVGELDGVKKTRTNEISSLSKDEKQQRVIADELKKKQSKLSVEQKAKQKQIEAAQKRLNELIAEEARKARGETLTAAQQEYNAVLTGRFDQNQGKLPYPVRGGVIIEKFGSSPTGNLSNPSKGVKIATTAGAQVNCAFEGTVSTVFAIPGMNNGIIVRHGNYMTVYANITVVSVKKGDKVSLNQKIGTLPSTGDPDNYYVHFEICRMGSGGDIQHLNPESWLHR